MDSVHRIILPRDDDPLDVRPMYLDEPENVHCQVDSRRGLTVPEHAKVSFATYFNAFPASYWKRWTEVDEVVLGHGFPWTGLDVQHTEAGLDLHDVGLLGMLRARVDVALDTGPCERGRERVDVDVHPATVAGTRLGQRRRVHAEDGDAAL